MQDAGHGPVKLAVNVSALQFGRSDFVQSVASVLYRTGMQPELLELELTESLVMRDAIAASRRMAELRDLGVGILIDDFGTGYSSLSYLRRLPAYALKIDQSFLEEMLLPGGSLPLVQTIVSLAHNMGLKVIAEGVETKEQFTVLRSCGCDFMQGCLFGESVTADRVDGLLKRRANLLPDA
jgi:EAL domain-containing protein (putative c-di-GMP-specific phosphodiesterase class I)